MYEMEFSEENDRISPVFNILDEAKKAIDANLWILGLMGILAVPDICVALESEKGETSGKAYKEWWGKYLGSDYRSLDSGDFWQLRCSMVHQGNTRAKSYDRVIFPAPSPGYFHNIIIERVLQIDLPTLWEDVRSAVENWRKGDGDTATTLLHEREMVKWHRGGLPGYFEGVDVLS